MTLQCVLAEIEVQISRAGSLRQLAREWQLSPGYLCDVLSGRKTPGVSILDNLDIERMVIYVRKSLDATPVNR